MLNTSSGVSPWMAASSSNTESADPWGLGAIMEAQARLWNHLLDANRSLWEFYAPWLSAGPSLWGTALAPLEHDDAGEEPAQTADGLPDALETQARSWNHLLDANRNFWNAFGLMPAGGLAAAQARVDDAQAEQEPTEQQPAARPRAAKHRPAKKSPRAGGAR